MSVGPSSAYSFDTKTPELIDPLLALRRSIMLDLRVSFPVTVSQVGPGGTKVDVMPDHLAVTYTDDGEQTQPAITIPGVPVWVYGQGAVGGAYLQFPVRVGDKGLVIVGDRDLSDWYEGGIPAPPPHYRAHSVSDSVFLPGLRDSTRAQAEDPSAAVLEALIIKLGANATEPAALAATLAAFLGQLVVWLGTHTHTAPVPVGPPALPPPTLPDITSKKVFIE